MRLGASAMPRSLQEEPVRSATAKAHWPALARLQACMGPPVLQILLSCQPDTSLHVQIVKKHDKLCGNQKGHRFLQVCHTTTPKLCIHGKWLTSFAYT